MASSLYMQPVQDLTVEDIVSRTQYQYSIEDPERHRACRLCAAEFMAKLKTFPSWLMSPAICKLTDLETSLRYDRQTASRVGITAQNIDDTLYDSFGQRQVSTLFTQLNQYHVILEVQPQFQIHPSNLQDIYIRSTGGGRCR